MKKRNSVVVKLALLTIGGFLLLFSIFNVIINYVIHQQNIESGEQITSLHTSQIAAEIAQHFNKSAETLTAEEQFYRSLLLHDQLNSNIVVDYKFNNLQNNDGLLVTTTIIKATYLSHIEPEHEQYIDKDGYFAPYVMRSNNDISVEALEEATNGDWFTEVAKTGKLVITDPYDFEVNGEKLSMVTISQPIFDNNTLIGVTVVDFPLTFMDEIIGKNLPDTAIQCVASANGTIILDTGSADNVSTSLDMSTAIHDISNGAQYQAQESEKANSELQSLGQKMDTLSTVADEMLLNIDQTLKRQSSNG